MYHKDRTGDVVVTTTAPNMLVRGIISNPPKGMHGYNPKINDEMEANVIYELFSNKDNIPKVSSTKSGHGHVMGATGAIELLSCIFALRENVIVPTIGMVKQDPMINIDLVCLEAQEQKVEITMSNSFAFGGLNSTIILKSV